MLQIYLHKIYQINSRDHSDWKSTDSLRRKFQLEIMSSVSFWESIKLVGRVRRQRNTAKQIVCIWSAYLFLNIMIIFVDKNFARLSSILRRCYNSKTLKRGAKLTPSLNYCNWAANVGLLGNREKFRNLTLTANRSENSSGNKFIIQYYRHPKWSTNLKECILFLYVSVSCK